MRIREVDQLDRLDFAKGGGLVPVVTQHARTGEVLMVAYADRDALARTLESGQMWYRSRSREALWHKGETSGNTQRLVALHADCDSDTVLAHVLPAGPSCHTGAWSCFEAAPTLTALATVIEQRRAADPEQSYTARLLGDRNLRLKKLGEETAELVAALAEGDEDRAAEEAADLLYHVLAACAAAGVTLDRVLAVLAHRAGGEGPVS
ncbi:MAG: bifunctional phosphoribosyl-AMP cyclohydrolase/phosphoribosyl-ATP diphosphatase HisIE [Gemmatimonadota bacterium]